MDKEGGRSGREIKRDRERERESWLHRIGKSQKMTPAEE